MMEGSRASPHSLSFWGKNPFHSAISLAKGTVYLPLVNHPLSWMLPYHTVSSNKCLAYKIKMKILLNKSTSPFLALKKKYFQPRVRLCEHITDGLTLSVLGLVYKAVVFLHLSTGDKQMPIYPNSAVLVTALRLHLTCVGFLWMPQVLLKYICAEGKAKCGLFLLFSIKHIVVLDVAVYKSNGNIWQHCPQAMFLSTAIEVTPVLC